MTITQPQPTTTDPETDPDHNLVHWCCNDHRDGKIIGLCGTNLNNDRVAAHDEPVDCIVCIELDKIDKFCPRKAICDCEGT